MTIGSAIAIYFLFWSLSVFLVLPFRLRADETVDQAVPGEDRGAPPRFSPRRTAIWTTVVASVLFAVFYLNYVNGWLAPDVFDFFSPADRLSDGKLRTP